MNALGLRRELLGNKFLNIAAKHLLHVCRRGAYVFDFRDEMPDVALCLILTILRSIS
jgi:hypothetical protein